MKASAHTAAASRIDAQLATRGFRFTRQRQHVYDVLLKQRDHPTAEEVFMRAKQHLPEISFATVYNCLDALVQSGLVKQVRMDRAACRFCPNMHEHCHFQCESCGGIFDVDLDEHRAPVPLPRGFKATHFELSIRGLCPACSQKRRA